MQRQKRKRRGSDNFLAWQGIRRGRHPDRTEQKKRDVVNNYHLKNTEEKKERRLITISRAIHKTSKRGEIITIIQTGEKKNKRNYHFNRAEERRES